MVSIGPCPKASMAIAVERGNPGLTAVGSMKFYQLNALVAVADAGSIRGAAKRLDTSPARSPRLRRSSKARYPCNSWCAAPRASTSRSRQAPAGTGPVAGCTDPQRQPRDRRLQGRADRAAVGGRDALVGHDPAAAGGMGELMKPWLRQHHHRPFSGYSTAIRTWSVSSSAWAVLPRCTLYWRERRVPFAAPFCTT